jgi:hypothetical protein
MGMGYGANLVDIVNSDFVKKTCPKEYKVLEALIEEDEMGGMDGFAQECRFEDYQTDEQEQAVKNLQNTFEKKTGLSIVLSYHDQQDEGDRYDEIDGAFWAVLNVWEMSDAGKKNKKHLEQRSFVTFG